AATVERLAERFERLLAALGEDSGRRLSELPLLGAAEMEQLRAWNATAVALDPGLSLPDLFARQVAATPDLEAVRSGGRSLTYRQLDGAVGRLAARLRALGIGTDGVVGVCAERSLEMVVALYAVQRAGGAYLPLDPDYPPERLAFMLEDSRVPLVLAQEHLLARLPSLDG